MPRSSMFPSCFEFVGWLELGVTDPQLMLGAKRKEKVPIAVGIAYSVFAQNRHPRVVVTANSSIKVTHDDCFVACTDGVQYIRQLLLESILCCFGMLHCWCIYVLMRCKYRFLPIGNRSVIMRSECPIGNSVSLMSDLIANPTPDSRFSVDGFPCQ